MYCRQCGHIIEVEGHFCGNCGAPIPEEDQKNLRTANGGPAGNAASDAARSDATANDAASSDATASADATAAQPSEAQTPEPGRNESPWTVDQSAPTLSFGAPEAPDPKAYGIPDEPQPSASQDAGFEEPVPKRPEPEREQASGAWNAQDGDQRPPQYRQEPYQRQTSWQVQDPNKPRRPTSYLIPNIVASVLCCPANLLGIVGIIFSILAGNRYDQGNYQEAKNFALVGMILFWVTIGLGVLSWIGIGIFGRVWSYGMSPFFW